MNGGKNWFFLFILYIDGVVVEYGFVIMFLL